MKSVRYTVFALLAVTLSGTIGCKKFSELALDPNKPSQSTPSLILTGVISTAFSTAPILGYEIRASQYIASDNSQQSDQAYTWSVSEKWTHYDVLRNVERLRIESERTGSPVYGIIAKFFKAYCFIEISNQVGDIPMSDALKGTDGNYTPKYDTQKEVFKACLALLNEANTEMGTLLQTSPNVPIDGDILYGGSASKWQKLINSYRLRLLIDLSKKEGDADLNIKAQFASIMGDAVKYPIFTSNADGAIFRWYDKEGNRYPRFYVPSNMDYYRFSTTFTQYAIPFNDPRLFVIARITQNAKDGGKQPGDITAYGGVNSGLSISDIYNQKDATSMLNTDRYSTATGEPMIIVGYPELNFNIAEAINRGWITGNANDYYYQKGIRVSMEFFREAGGTITDAQINTYLAQGAVQYGGNLNQVLIQKYMAFFNNSGWESFYNIRRTGVPVLAIGPGNGNNNKIPLRWTYPQTEYQYNEANVKAAIQSQFAGSDDRNGKLWINQ